jgi:hypothetical protein
LNYFLVNLYINNVQLNHDNEMDDVYIYYKYDYYVVNTIFYDVMMMYLLDVYNKDGNDLLYSSQWSFLFNRKKEKKKEWTLL